MIDLLKYSRVLHEETYELLEKIQIMGSKRKSRLKRLKQRLRNLQGEMQSEKVPVYYTIRKELGAEWCPIDIREVDLKTA